MSPRILSLFLYSLNVPVPDVFITSCSSHNLIFPHYERFGVMIIELVMLEV